MKRTRLERREFWNPFYCNGKEVSFIEFTENGEPVGTINQGWFNGGSSNNVYKFIELPFDVKNKRTYSNKVEAFMIKAQNDYKNGYKLVLPVELLPNFFLSKNVKEYETKTEICYTDYISFTATANKSEYIKDDIKGIVRKYTGEKTHTIKAKINWRYEKTELGEQLNSFQQAAKSVGISLTMGQFQELQKVFNISLK